MVKPPSSSVGSSSSVAQMASQACDRRLTSPHWSKPGFHAVMNEALILLQTLNIPEKFVEKFGSELSSLARLTVPNGRMWWVSTQRFGSEIWFRDGWQGFVEHYSVRLMYRLEFKYQGGKSFHVRIFDPCGIEIHYRDDILSILEGLKDGSNISIFSEDEECLNYSEETDGGDSISQDSVIVISTDDEVPPKYICENCGKSRSYPQKIRGTWASRRIVEDMERHVARTLKPQNPYFIKILRRTRRSGFIVKLPSDFAEDYMRGTGSLIILQDSEGREFPVHCVRRQGGIPKMFSRGWNEFASAHNFHDKDVCVFELIRRSSVTLKVHRLCADSLYQE